MPKTIIDTHVHIWQLDRSRYEWLKSAPAPLARDYPIMELEQDRAAAGVTSGILVQADNSLEDTAWMLQTAAVNNWIAGVVGWLPLLNPDATARLLEERYSKHPYFKGVRHLIHDEADPAWLLQEPVIESLRILAQYGLPYDLVGVSPAHIETALRVAEKVPDLRMIFDHMNQPPIATGERFGQWGSLMKEAARNARFHVKISGLGTTAGAASWSADAIRPYIAFALEHFGEDRCCCGSDWPVSLLADSYTNTWAQYQEVLTGLLDDVGLDKLYAANAVSFYQV